MRDQIKKLKEMIEKAEQAKDSREAIFQLLKLVACARALNMILSEKEDQQELEEYLEKRKQEVANNPFGEDKCKKN